MDTKIIKNQGQKKTNFDVQILIGPKKVSNDFKVQKNPQSKIVGEKILFLKILWCKKGFVGEIFYPKNFKAKKM